MRKEDLKVDLASRKCTPILASLACSTACICASEQCITTRRAERCNSVRRGESDTVAAQAIELWCEPVLRTIGAKYIAR